jgi:hypothetical protein
MFKTGRRVVARLPGGTFTTAPITASTVPAARSPHDQELLMSAAVYAVTFDWRDRVLPTLSAMLISAPERLRLAPTARSLLR